MSGDTICQSPPRTGGLIYDHYQPLFSIRPAGRSHLGSNDPFLPGPKNTCGAIGEAVHVSDRRSRDRPVRIVCSQSSFDQVL
jgi:hypothetical protein